ncbi:regulatory LuxR family protein [Actinocrispum wychmicini]|uniref:Regulatory LuxR family protein n=2 Tax=Actinocrispum wychmicini TaxID=1213861 RepID=A0A4R2J6W5_9PSEU|nr:regulatory LuxR family protein [Actinocrispum wychmicini]
MPRGAAVPSLVKWGLSADADLAYRDLVAFGPRTTGELARDLAISGRRAQAAIEELAAAGAASPEPNAPDRRRRLPSWRPAAAAELVPELRRRKAGVVDLGGYARRHRRLLDTLAPAGGLRANHLADRATTRRRIAEISAVERWEHLTVSTERTFTPEAVAAALPLDRQLVARGVQLRACGVPSGNGEGMPPELSYAIVGTEYRECPEVPAKLMVIDRRVALPPVDPLDLDAGTYEIDDPDAVGALVNLFEHLWSTGIEPRRSGVPTIELSPREKVILGLLADGHTDSSAAKHLGISQRTIAYTLRALMDRVGVDNRFQLGLTLGATRAVPPPTGSPEG